MEFLLHIKKNNWIIKFTQIFTPPTTTTLNFNELTKLLYLRKLANSVRKWPVCIKIRNVPRKKLLDIVPIKISLIICNWKKYIKCVNSYVLCMDWWYLVYCGALLIIMCASWMCCMLSVAEWWQRESKLCGHRRGSGGLFPEPEDSAAVRTHQLCTCYQQSGKVSLKCVFVRFGAIILISFLSIKPEGDHFFICVFIGLRVFSFMKCLTVGGQVNMCRI